MPIDRVSSIGRGADRATVSGRDTSRSTKVSDLEILMF